MAGDDKRTRNREGTEAAILAAAKAVLADDGFQGLGINAIARRAACDKQLIYRYFGGLDGLVEAIGGDLASWLEHSVAPSDPPATYAAFVEHMVLAFLDELRANPLVQKIAAWEIAEPSPLIAKLAAARAIGLANWVESSRGQLQPPSGIDAGAINAMLIAAIQHMVLSAATTGGFASLALRTDADWDRVRDAVGRLVRAAYAHGEAVSSSAHDD